MGFASLGILRSWSVAGFPNITEYLRIGNMSKSFRRIVTGDHGSDRHALMHRTSTIDYGIVLEGEITLILDEDETVVKAGDIVIQRGTNHAWANRGTTNCRIAFILVDGQFEDGL